MLELEQDVGTCQLKAIKMTPVDWCALFCIVSCMLYKLLTESQLHIISTLMHKSRLDISCH